MRLGMDRGAAIVRAHPLGVALLLVALIAAILSVLFYSSTWRTGDDGRYYIIGVAISEGAGLVQYENPLQPQQALTLPLYPALIAVMIRLTDNPVVWVKITGNLLFILNCLLALRMLGEGHRWSWPAVLGACMGLYAVGVVAIASWIMADTLFMTLIFLCLWQAQRPPGRGRALMVGVLAGLAYLTRPAGMAVWAAVLLPPLLRRQWRQLGLILCGLGLVVAPWFYWYFFRFQGPDPNLVLADQHARMFRGTGLWMSFPMLMATEIIRDLPGYVFRVIPANFFYSAHKVFGSGGLWRGVGIGVGLCAVIGFSLRVRRWNELDGFFVFTLLLIAAIPGPIYDQNYFYPVLPIFALYVFEFAGWASRQASRTWRHGRVSTAVKLTAGLLFAFSLSLNLSAGVVHFVKENPRRPYAPWAPERYLAFGQDYYHAWAGVSAAATWIRYNTPADAVLLSRKPEQLFVMSGRQGWRSDIPRSVQCETIMEAVQRFAPDRMVLLLEDAFPTGAMPNAYGNSRNHVLNQTVRKEPDQWQMRYEVKSPVTRVWAYGAETLEPPPSAKTADKGNP